MVNDKLKINIVRGALLAVVGAGVATVGTLWFRRRNSIPSGVEPLSSFELEKYLGKWYEIARIDFRFERNLINTTADYQLGDDGLVSVVNTGYNAVKEKWQQAHGKLQFVGDSSTAAMEVSFYGPFYSGYNVVAIEGDYEYALVVGRTLDLCWILSRTPQIPVDVQTRLLSKAMSIGVKINNLNWVEQSEQEPADL